MGLRPRNGGQIVIRPPTLASIVLENGPVTTGAAEPLAPVPQVASFRHTTPLCGRHWYAKQVTDKPSYNQPPSLDKSCLHAESFVRIFSGHRSSFYGSNGNFLHIHQGGVRPALARPDRLRIRRWRTLRCTDRSLLQHPPVQENARCSPSSRCQDPRPSTRPRPKLQGTSCCPENRYGPLRQAALEVLSSQLHGCQSLDLCFL
ncbi:hypothetical protein WJX74_004157 [Apatococcus lobatus]|uniref:Uncharacterized protein n=1 Tax=Apatococcus lobatus TaxID=904363 RepID=A0AAW1RKD9_9CHLO